MAYNEAGDGRVNIGGLRDRADGLALPRASARRFAGALKTTESAAVFALSGAHNQHWASPLSGTTSGWFDSGNTVTQLSMSAWIFIFPQQSNLTSMGFFGIEWGNGPLVSGIGIMGNTSNGTLKFAVGPHSTAANNAICSGTTLLTSGVWFHMVGVFDTTEAATARVKGYIDGLVQLDSGTRNTAHVISGGTIVAGVSALSGQTGFSSTNAFCMGALRELAIWNRALTSGEVVTLYNSGSPLDITADVGLSSGLRGWWRTGDGVGDCPEVMRDQSGNPSGLHLYPQAYHRSLWPPLMVLSS